MQQQPIQPSQKPTRLGRRMALRFGIVAIPVAASFAIPSSIANSTAPSQNKADPSANKALVASSAAAEGESMLKTWEDAARSLYALAPSAESGLFAITADKTITDDAPRIQAMLNYLKTTYGGGRLLLPFGRTSRMNSGVTIPAGVQVVGARTARWDFWFAGSAVTAVTIKDKSFTPILGLSISGNQWDANRPTHNTTTSTGLDIQGDTLNFQDVHVSGFNVGIDFTNDSTYIISFEQSTIVGCMLGINLDLANNWTGAAGPVSNSGERMAFTDCVIANSDTAYWASGNGVGLYFTQTSFDFVRMWGQQFNSHVFVSNCHFESTGTTYTSPFMFLMDGNSRLNLSNSNFILGAPGIYYLVNPAKAPYNFGIGLVQANSCNVQANKTPGANAAGAKGTGFSEGIVQLAAGETTVIISSLFVSKWTAMKVSVISAGGWVMPANLTARVSAANFTDGTVTVTMSAPAPVGGVFIELDF